MKKVNTQRVDCLKASVAVGLTHKKQKMVARFDKLSIVSDLGIKKERKQLRNALFGIHSDIDYKVKFYSSKVRERSSLSAMYEWSIEIQDNNKPDVAKNIVTIWFKSRWCKRGDFRLEMSPQHFTGKEITQLVLWLADESRLGDMVFEVLKKAWITSIHYALDIYGMRLGDYIIGMERCSKGEVRKDENGMEGIVLGHANTVAAIYEKVDVSEYSEKDLRKESYVMLNPGEYRKFLRIEMRFKPKKGALELGHLNNMVNLLERLAFYDKSFIDDPKLDPMFVAALDVKPMPLAMEEHKISPKINGVKVSISREAAKKRIRKVRDNYRVEVFDSHMVWLRLFDVIEKLGILGEPILWYEKPRKRRYSSSDIV